MACDRCACTCPVVAGDPIRYKPIASGPSKGVRPNGGLELTLAYLGSRYCIYTWAARSTKTNEVIDGGEVMLSREEFDAKIERDPRPNV